MPADRSHENPIATRVIYEDDEVRVWDQVIAAGATLGRHTHELDYVLVTVRGEGPLDVRFHDGSGGALGDRLMLRTRRGDATYVPKGHVETAINEGEEYRAILVELKR
jgi:mannose-6-phosphate isomerase-like protein (cupin superfamily)